MNVVGGVRRSVTSGAHGQGTVGAAEAQVVASGSASAGAGGRRLLVPGVGALGTAVTALYLLHPQGIGGVAFLVTAVAGFAGLALGPGLRRARPRGPWLSMAAAAFLFIIGLTLRTGVLPSSGSLVASPDLWTILGYFAALRSLAGLLSHAVTGSGRLAAVDAVIVTSGAALGFFSAEVGPHLREAADAAALTTTALHVVYPVLDAALLSFTVHLAFRTSGRSPSMVLFLAAMTTWLIADIGYVAFWHFHPFTTSPYLNAIFLLTYGLMGAAATHPTVVDLAAPATATQAPARSGRTILLLTLLVPAGTAVVVPVSGGVDALIRVVLLSLTLIAVVRRMTLTVDALRDAEEAALHQALHDPLTGLPNRAAFLAAVRDTLSGLSAGEVLSLICLDADRFKLVNDTWGHPAGDELIRQLAHRLTGKIRADDRLFRLGGDEFVVIPGGATPEAAERVAQRLLTVSSEPFQLSGGQRITVTASVGVARVDASGERDADALMRDADIALYTAKDRGRDRWVRFDESLRSSVQRRVTLADALGEAVAEGQIVPHYQAIMTGPGFGAIDGFEALARWTHPDLGVVNPAEFIPVAEDTGLIVEIGELMLRQACHQLVAWRRVSGEDLHVSVNLSAAQLARIDVPTMVHEALEEAALPPEALWLEITESLLMADRGGASDVLRRLVDLGVTLCIDDFGTGYSSLSYLHDFPVDIVKVDRAVIHQLGRNARSTGVTRAIVEMVKALDLRGVVAEGVETPEQAAFLEDIGCRWGQGFLWARPIPTESVQQLFDARPSRLVRP
jgi:diguanylate cyclase